MPPKKNISAQRASSKKIHSDIIPIYEILSSKDISQPLVDLMPQIQKFLRSDPIALKISFLNMLIRICGLEQYASNINQQDTIQSLQTILCKAYEIKKTEITPLILAQNNKFHKEFLKRLKQFIQAVISDEAKVFNDQSVQFNQSFMTWLRILTNSKFRTIRNASMRFVKLLIEQEISLCNLYHQNKTSKKAFTVSKSIHQYLETIVAPRLIDIDQAIREISFESTYFIIEQLEADILSEQLLHKICTPLFDERLQVLDPFIKMVLKLMQKCKDKKIIYDYLKDRLMKIISLSKNTQFTRGNTLALRIIQILHHNEPTLKLLNRDYLSSFLETYAPLNLFYGLHAGIDVFYQSLYRTSEELQANSSIVLIEIINLLIGVNNEKNLETILAAFFNSTRKIEPTKLFNIDNMFNLLISEFYRDQKNNDVKLKQKQIRILLFMICNWIKHCSKSYQHLIKQKPVYQKILQSYNTHILINCKLLFFQKMTEHKQIADMYLALYTNLHGPTITFSDIENYLDFVAQKSIKLFGEQLDNISVYRQIVNILTNLENINGPSSKYLVRDLVPNLKISNLVQQDGQMMEVQVYQACALLTKSPVNQLVDSQEYLFNLLKTFIKSGNDRQKMEILVILSFLHHYNFLQLFNNPSERQQNFYKQVRNKILRLYLEVLANSAQNLSVKLSAFRSLTFMLRMISSRRFEQSTTSKANSYQLSSQDMKIIYDFIAGQLFNSDSVDYSSMDLAKMLQRMSFQGNEIKSIIINLLFNLFEQSYVFTCHPQSAKFLIIVIKMQYMLHQNINKRVQNLIISQDLCYQLQRRLNKLLDNYLIEEIKQNKKGKIIYWRLCYQIFSQSRQDSRFDRIMDKLLISYFSKRKLDQEKRKNLKDKLMIFILHAVDKILEKQDYIQLDIYQNIFRKVSKKFEKQVLIRVKEFFIEKTQGIRDNFVTAFLETVQGVAKVVRQNKKKGAKEQDDDNDEDQSGQSNPEKDGQRDAGSDDEEEEEMRMRPARNTRSATKKKIK